MCRKIRLFHTFATTLSHGTFSACRNEWNPITPSPTDRSRIAEYRAFSIPGGARSMKSCSTLSRNRMTSSMKVGCSSHSNHVSRFSEHRQHTAVRSLPCWSRPVGSVISLHRLDVFTSSPASL